MLQHPFFAHLQEKVAEEAARSQQHQLFVKDPSCLMDTAKSPEIPQVSPLHMLQSQMGLSPHQLQVLLQHHQQTLALQQQHPQV